MQHALHKLIAVNVFYIATTLVIVFIIFYGIIFMSIIGCQLKKTMGEKAEKRKRENAYKAQLTLNDNKLSEESTCIKTHHNRYQSKISISNHLKCKQIHDTELPYKMSKLFWSLFF